jgi:hypothetical protein
MSIQEKSKRVLEQAMLLALKAKSWTDFSNKVFAQEDSLVADAFPRMTERSAFYDSPEYQQINQVMLELIKRFGVADGALPKKSGKFVVRVPRTLHSFLEVEAKDEGVSLNQLALSKLSVRLKDTVDLTTSLLVEAYKQVYDGFSSDRVLIEPDLNKRFLERCHKLGLGQSDFELNHLLCKIRKDGKSLLPPATKKPRITDYDDFVFGSEIAFRHLQRKFEVSLDRVLCDLEMREKFDAIAKQLTSERSVFKLRMGALYLRKIHRLKPNSVTPPAYILKAAGNMAELKLDKLPEASGAYVFYDATRPVYAGETSKLRHRIQLHLEAGNSGKVFLPKWLELGGEEKLELRYAVMPGASSAERLSWLNSFVNRERPALNYQYAA